jgi:hypothetical protein
MDDDTMSGLMICLILVVIWVYTSFCFQRIAQKSKTDMDWLAWVPIANTYLMCKMTRTSGWWVLLICVPYIGMIFLLILLSRVPKCLGIKGASRFLILVPFFNFIYLGYLAFRKEPAEINHQNPS